MGAATSKLLLPLAGRPVLAWSLSAFKDLVGHLVVTAPPVQLAAFTALVEDLLPAGAQQGRPPAVAERLVASSGLQRVEVIAGGATRTQSVALALARLPAEGLVLVHDGARPLVGPELIARVIAGAQAHGACIPSVPVVDTIKRVDRQGRVLDTPARTDLAAVQTPQGFDLQLLRRAYAAQGVTSSPGAGPTDATDDAQLVERLGLPVHCVPGDERNRKLTTAADLAILEALAAAG